MSKTYMREKIYSKPKSAKTLRDFDDDDAMVTVDQRRRQAQIKIDERRRERRELKRNFDKVEDKK
jgi:hypothetical protein